MATEQSITISGTPPEVTGVTVPVIETDASELEVYVGKGKVESEILDNAGAGYADATNAALEFSGGGGSSAALTVDVANGQVSLDNDGVPTNKGSGYTTAPIVGFGNISGGTAAAARAEIFAKKTVVTDYSISGTSGSATITFTSPLTNGDIVKIKRVTDVTSPANNFQSGSSITAKALNDSFNQIRHRVEELPDLLTTSLVDGDKGDITVSGNTWTIDDGSVNSDKLASNAVTHLKITDSNVTLPKIENIAQDRVLGRTATGAGAVTAIQVDREMIADDAINKDKIAADGVDSEQIKDNAVVQNKIGNDSVDEPRLQISNAGTNGQYLQKQSGNTGGLTWASPTERLLEYFSIPCKGTKRSFTSPHTAQTWTVDEVTSSQSLSSTYGILTGTSIEYYPPANAKTVVYKYTAHAGPGDTGPLFHARLYFGPSEAVVTEVEAAIQTTYLNANEFRWTFEWPFRITGSGNGADANLGQMETWTTSKNIHLKVREYGDSNEVQFHSLYHIDGGTGSYFVPPILTISAYT